MLVNCIINFGWCTAGGAAVPTAPTELLALLLGWCTATWLVHLRLLHEQLLYLAVSCAHDVDATLEVLYAYSTEVVYLDVGIVIGSG